MKLKACILFAVQIASASGGVQSGYSCSELVLRTAQAAGIPYYFKNSTTLNQNGQLLGAHEKLEAGDLIWMPGHIAIISNIERNEIIEAAGPHTGYNCVHRIPLKRLFKDVSTFEQLQKLYRKKKGITRLKKNGSIDRVYTEFKLFKLL